MLYRPCALDDSAQAAVVNVRFVPIADVKGGYIKDVDLRSAKPKNMTLDEFLPPCAKLIPRAWTSGVDGAEEGT